jgi:multiple sugar transport system substrate-binding protein
VSTTTERIAARPAASVASVEASGGRGRGLSRRGAAGGLAAGAGLLLAGACGIGGAGGRTAGAPAKAVACTGPLDVVSPWGPGSTTGDGLTQFGQDFAAAHAGCTARLLFVSDNNTVIMEKLVAAIAGGDPPPVTLVPAQQTPLWISKGVVQPLDAYAKRDGVAKDQFVEGYWPQMVVGGKLWRLPFNIDVNFPWFVNKKLFRAAGLNPDRGPATIQEVDELANKLTRGGPGAHEQLGLVPWQLYGPGNSSQSWAYAFGGEFYDVEKDRIIANHPKTVEAFEWMAGWARRLGGYDEVEAELQAMGGWGPAFGTGRLAMATQTSDGLGGSLRTYPDLEVTGSLFPGGPGVKPGEATWLSGRGVGIVAGTKDPEAAWAFVKWAGATDEGTLAAVSRIKATPGLKASPGLAVLEKDPLFKPFVDALRAARHNPPGALIPVGLWGGNRGSWFVELLQGRRPVRETLDEATRLTQQELDAERARDGQKK